MRIESNFYWWFDAQVKEGCLSRVQSFPYLIRSRKCRQGRRIGREAAVPGGDRSFLRSCNGSESLERGNRCRWCRRGCRVGRVVQSRGNSQQLQKWVPKVRRPGLEEVEGKAKINAPSTG